MSEKMRESVKEIVIGAVGAVILAILINKFLIFSIYVPSGSMRPEIEIGDRMIVNRIYNYNKIERGDLLVFEFNEELEPSLYIKRVIGLPGDHIVMEGTNLYINGEKIEEDYVKFKEAAFLEYKVPQGHYFFLGDNRADSKDSRYWENPYIKESEIQGRVLFRFYPLNRIGILN